MIGKTGFVIVGVAMATFAIGPVQSLGSHRGFRGSVAWAGDDQAGDPAPDSAPPTVPDVNGSYSGPIDDHRFNSGTISAMISQTGKVLSGTWSSDLNGGSGGKLTGKVNSHSDVTLTLKVHGKAGCSIDAKGTFEDGDKISAVYVTSGCHHSDHGTFDITD